MCVCMCVCVYICVYECVCVRVREGMSVHMSVYERVYECVYLRLLLLLLFLLLLLPHCHFVLSSSHTPSSMFSLLSIACYLKGVLLSEWDGLRSSSAAPVVVLGATNRPMDLDKGIVCTVM